MQPLPHDDGSVNRRIIAGTAIVCKFILSSVSFSQHVYSSTAGAASLVSTIHSAIKRRPNIGSIALSTGLNAAIATGTLLTLRDHLISPALVHNITSPQYARQRLIGGIKPLSKDSGYSPTQLHATMTTHKVFDTFLSGAITGGVIRTLTSGGSAFIPGALLFGGFACTVQYGFNLMTTPKSESLEEINSRPFLERVLRLLGVRKVSDEEYIARLKALRAKYLVQIEKLERQLVEEAENEERKELR